MERDDAGTEEHYFTKGRIIVRGKTVQRGEAKKADYILFHKPNIPIAVVEAKDNNHSVGAGMQQAWIMRRRSMCLSPIAQMAMDSLNTIEPAKLQCRKEILRWRIFQHPPSCGRDTRLQRIHAAARDRRDARLLQRSSGKAPHYFQQVAINRTVDAIARARTVFFS